MTSPLLRKPFGTHGKVHEITPASAGWRYVGFSLYRLRAGDTAAEATGGNEVLLVLVEGKAQVTAAGRDWGELGERMDVFEKTPPHSLYLPNGTEWRVTAETDCTVAVCAAPGRGGHPPRRIGPDGITLTERGKGTNTRHINNIAMEAEDWCDSLLVTEVFTPAGHWSSYPSHRHDEDDFPRITYLEETYYHRLNPKDGFGIQRVYTDDGVLDETMAVKDGDVVLVPRGHHPCGAPYGFEMYYLLIHTPLLIPPYMVAGHAQKHVTYNEALRLLDSLVQLAVIDRDLTAAPGAPSDGDRYLVASGASGVWSGWDGNVAAWMDGAWMKLIPRIGWRCWVEDEGQLLAYASGGWTALGGGRPAPDVDVAVGPAGGTTGVAVAEELLSGLSGTFVESTVVIPNRAVFIGVSSRTVTAITGASSYDCGLPGEPSKFGGSLGVTTGSINAGVIGPQGFYTDTPIRLTANGGSFTDGAVRIAIHYRYRRRRPDPRAAAGHRRRHRNARRADRQPGRNARGRCRDTGA